MLLKTGNVAAGKALLCCTCIQVQHCSTALCPYPASAVKTLLVCAEQDDGGMAVGGAMVVAVGYAMVINMMATREV